MNASNARSAVIRVSGLAAVAAVIPIVYSFLLWRREKAAGQSSE